MGPVIRYAIIEGFLKKEIEDYGTLKLTAAGKKWLKNPEPFYVTEDNEFNEEEYDSSSEGAGAVLDPELFAVLKNLRKDVAKQHNVPPYVVFQDSSLEQMATMYPTTLEELYTIIPGVGRGKGHAIWCKIL